MQLLTPIRQTARIARLLISAAALSVSLVTFATDANAQGPVTYVTQPQTRVAYRPAYSYAPAATAPTSYVYATQPQPTAYTYAQPATAGYSYVQAAPTQDATGGQGGFLAWLNATRASYGLPAVGYDPNLANWAAMNSQQQAARGLGHFVMGPARRQNSAMGGVGSIGSMWMNSPAHRAALLDPSIRMIGLAGYGSYWTFNAY